MKEERRSLMEAPETSQAPEEALAVEDPCATCKGPITPLRRQMSPHTKTCSPVCSKLHLKSLRNKATKKWLAGKRARRQAAEAGA